MNQIWQDTLEDLLIGALAIIVFVLIYVPAGIARSLNEGIDKIWEGEIL